MSDDDLRARVLVARVTHRFEPGWVYAHSWSLDPDGRMSGVVLTRPDPARCARCGRREDDRAHE